MESQAYHTYQKAVSQIGNIKSSAEGMKNAMSSEVDNLTACMKGRWTGTNADTFIGKISLLQDKLNQLSTNLTDASNGFTSIADSEYKKNKEKED